MSIRDRLGHYREEALHKLTVAIQEEHTPHEVAVSFAIGIFVTTLPTGGLGIGLFFVFSALWSWICKPALFASVAVLNPFVKPAVYLSSVHVGGVLLGTNPIRSHETIAESATVTAHQLIVGNVVLATILSAISYVIVRRLTRLHRRRAHHSSDRSLVSTIRQVLRRN
ncbi:DUF2062 domain-containing protein [Natrialba asiatica]|uniref:DUF2062 domain-containing protein n=1 Tax=Natrialba asiatica (strain ATCC 700177 / DSM 12278 / JCM 9576 / FERM P-10747 / NBRC 102637 / 172P1) TaxID=29540 RepID=M0AMV8_NATA1|nr:DUF2062 domain-containing protein [Natrialba asiatica]ELZ00031.1 hypothetical protein C481_13584 [Natrialba asiatica DSM 12278]